MKGCNLGQAGVTSGQCFVLIGHKPKGLGNAAFYRHSVISKIAT